MRAVAGSHKTWNVNAVQQILSRASRATLLKLSRRRGAPDATLHRVAMNRFGGDLPACLNALSRDELDHLAEDVGIGGDGTIAELRARLWRWGARLEAGSEELLGSSLQPEPRVLRGKLVHYGWLEGTAAPSHHWPRPIPPARERPETSIEPDTLEELLDRASSLIGVRLGPRGRDKGAYGTRIAGLLGVGDDGFSEPDWRGEVEIKSLPVVRDRGGAWWVKEDPAISMESARPLAKLDRVLWIARVADDEESPILSWFFQERSWMLERLLTRDIHTRPKGGAGATTRGWYLHKRFFIDNGLLYSLNQG